MKSIAPCNRTAHCHNHCILRSYNIYRPIGSSHSTFVTTQQQPQHTTPCHDAVWCDSPTAVQYNQYTSG